MNLTAQTAHARDLIYFDLILISRCPFDTIEWYNTVLRKLRSNSNLTKEAEELIYAL